MNDNLQKGRTYLFDKFKSIIAQTYLAGYMDAFNVNETMVDEIMRNEIVPQKELLQTLEQVIAFGQQKTSYSPYFIFSQAQIEELYNLFVLYLATY